MSQPAPHILVVDDDASFLNFMAVALTSEGYEVVTAQHGATALALIASFQPDLIILDIRMPMMDGWEFMRQYRELPGPHVPIIALSATATIEAQVHDAGAAAFLPKPFDLNVLLETIARLLLEDREDNGAPHPASGCA
jgi:CheY-like chemotaxis protein